MIVRRKPGLWDILFAVNGSILPKVGAKLTTIAIITTLAIACVSLRPSMLAQISAVPFTLIGIALSVFMSFRNNACYDRWWEGRKLWGQLIISCRTFARQTSALAEPDLAVSVFGRGILKRLATRLYFADGDGNDDDPVLSAIPEERRGTLIARRRDDGRWWFDIRLQGDAETVFFAV